MLNDKKTSTEEGTCPECGEPLCENCGKCCHCGKCDCNHCHPKEEDNEPEVKETTNYP